MNLHLFICFLFWPSIILSSSSSGWNWTCIKDDEGGRCIRERISSTENLLSLSSCVLICGDAAALFPKPKKLKLAKEIVFFLPTNIHHSPTYCEDNVCSLLNEAFLIMLRTLNQYHPNFGEKVSEDLWKGAHDKNLKNHILKLDFKVKGMEEFLTMTTDESYTLETSTINASTHVVITAPTFFGARHALETLSQLIDYDKDRNALQIIKRAVIEDSPKFPYRGILVDTSRNFFSLKTLKRVIDGMAYNKLNTFHWHISDSQSFPLKLPSLPKMAEFGTYSPDEVYTPRDVRELVLYARVRGVRIIPEIDAPAHVGHGWEWGEEEGLGNLVVCLDKQPWNKYCAGPPCGQFNLANGNVYEVLAKVYKDIIKMFSPIEMFHYGGDEVNLECWNSSTEVQRWMTRNNFGLGEEAYIKQWSVFQEKARELFTAANGGKEVPGILWTSTLTKKERMDKYLDKSKYIIQMWSHGTDSVIKDILMNGFKVIFSNSDKLYLDCGSGSWVADGNNWCSPFKGWQEIYDNDILKIARNNANSTKYDHQVLGAEVAAWSEQIDENTLDSKLWPRGAAFAERLWTNPVGNYSTAEGRMVQHRHRLVQRGLRAERLQPEYCRQNERECRKPWQSPEKRESDLQLVNEQLVNEPLVNEQLVNEPLVNEQLINEQLVNELPIPAASVSSDKEAAKFGLLCFIIFNAVAFLF